MQFEEKVDGDAESRMFRVKSTCPKGPAITYLCQAENNAGANRAIVILEVEPREPPTLEIFPALSQTIVTGGSALYQCRPRTGVPAPSITWTRVDRRPLAAASTLRRRRARSHAARMALTEEAAARFMTDDVGNNVTPYIANLLGRDLYATPAKSVLPPPLLERSPPAPLTPGRHRTEAHPLGIIKGKIEEYFNSLEGQNFEIVDNLEPFVNAQECFDDLLIPPDHPGALCQRAAGGSASCTTPHRRAPARRMRGGGVWWENSDGRMRTPRARRERTVHAACHCLPPHLTLANPRTARAAGRQKWQIRNQ